MCYKIQGIPQKRRRFPLSGGQGSQEGHAVTGSRSLLLSQAVSISKAINTQEAPVKEKHARRILSLGSPGGCGGHLGGLRPAGLELREGWGAGNSRREFLGGGMESCRFVHW